MVVALSAYFGRLPVLFYFLVLATATAIWCAAAKSFESFMAARILNGFFSTVSQGGGLMFIYDMFFFHERARKINIWSAFIILSPYFGPLFAAFIIAKESWQVPFWVYVAETALCLVLVILFVEETYYDRRLPSQPERGSHITRLLGLAQWKSRHLRNTFTQAMMRPVKTILKPTVFLTALYYLLTFAWVVRAFRVPLLSPISQSLIGRDQYYPFNLPYTSVQLRSDIYRLLLFHTYRSCPSWRVYRPLAARFHRESVHQEPRRPF